MTIKWKRIDAERYDWLLGCVPPAVWTSHGFLVGEAYDDFGPNGATRFTACVEHKSELAETEYFEALRPITVAEFRALKKADVTANVEA